MVRTRRCLVFGLLVSASSIASGEIVSISDRPIPVKGIENPLDVPIAFSTSIRPAEQDTRPFIEKMSRLFASFPCPVVCWADPETSLRTPFNTESRTWRQLLDSLSTIAGPCRVTQFSGFVEVVWADPKSRGRLRKGLSENVQPIAFLANNPGEFLTMWYVISGIDVRYDTQLVKRAIEACEKGRVDFESLSDMCWAFDSEELPAVFTVEESLPLEEFMSLLALQFGGSAWRDDGAWTIGPLREKSEEMKILKRALEKIKDPSFDARWREAEVILKKAGHSILPLLLEEFDRAEDACFDQLAWILATLPSSERDKAFIEKLEECYAQGYDYYDRRYVPAMLEALGANNCKEAVPLTEKFARLGGKEFDQARIALNLLGEPMPEREPDELLEVEEGVREAFANPHVRDHVKILYAALDQCFLGPREDPLFLTDVELERESSAKPSGEDPVPTRVVFKGSYADGVSEWEVVVGKPRDSRVSVYAARDAGPMAGTGYQGQAELKEGRWLFVKWWQCWMG